MIPNTSPSVVTGYCSLYHLKFVSKIIGPLQTNTDGGFTDVSLATMFLNIGLVSVFRMFLQNFPKALPDELLGSVLARSVHQLGIQDDKVALKLLFGSRNIVPSGLMQGHIDMLLGHVGHIWSISPSEVIQRHSLLPLFRPFSTEEKYGNLLADLRSGRTNFGMLRSGINASSLKWPNTFRVCPVCWHEQWAEYGFAVWARVLQCPGVECCPDHKCLLVDSQIPMLSERRHEDAPKP